jgi:hypothetical protein
VKIGLTLVNLVSRSVPLNLDGTTLPGEWDLRRVGAATQLLQSDLRVTSVWPNHP